MRYDLTVNLYQNGTKERGGSAVIFRGRALCVPPIGDWCSSWFSGMSRRTPRRLCFSSSAARILSTVFRPSAICISSDARDLCDAECLVQTQRCVEIESSESLKAALTKNSAGL